MARVVFLGTGGGRYVTLSQVRATGGWILEMSGEIIHIDPGPGALVRAKEFGVNLKRITGVVVSHRHPDHYTDMEVVVEAMTRAAKIKRGFFISTGNIIEGDEKEPPKISRYHLGIVDEYKAMEAGECFERENIKIYAVPTRHGKENGLGFVFRGEKDIGYTGDGEYFEGQEKHFKGCDCLVINCMRPRIDAWPGHMNVEQARVLIERSKPKMAILQHFGMKMLFGKAEKEAAWIERETGVKTIAARDGIKLDISGEGLSRFL